MPYCSEHGHYMSVESRNCPKCFPMQPPELGAQLRDAEKITLEDKFAMAALTGLLASGLAEHWDASKGQLSGWQEDTDRRWAAYCYRMARAMLQAREKENCDDKG